MIISNISAGWCSFDLDGFHGHPSYITPVPIDILEGLLHYLEYGTCTISFDEERSYFHLILTEYNTYIIEEKDKAILISISEDPNDVAAILYDDVINNKETWIEWLSDNERDFGHYRKIINKLEEKINARRKNKRT